MAAVELTTQKLNRLLDRHDRPFRWPTATCCHVVFDIVELVHGYVPPLPEYFEWSESRVYRHLQDNFGGSFVAAGLAYLQTHNLGVEVALHNAKLVGDIVEIVADDLIFDCPLQCGLGVILTPFDLAVRTRAGVMPLGCKQVQIKRAVRICRRS